MAASKANNEKNAKKHKDLMAKAEACKKAKKKLVEEEDEN